MADAVKEGSTVMIDYVGTLEDGSLFDTSIKEEAEKVGLPTDQRPFEPLKVEVGKHQVIPGFEEALVGMKEGETKEFDIEPEKAYGMPNPAAVQDVPKKMFEKSDIELKAGLVLLMKTPEGHALPVKVLEVGDDTVKLDANHPLAGKKLHFKITLKKIE
ncbi:peptidylprolyl isomerase [Candidatus Woesearchaeota archaeon CG08_land_8_20_14_0_20_43_7]|nr:MAG: peptidylprolyl isomerase [Candidatus Woesearchaeota archaeon CG08_land_8_20_14_0_20_43_7]